MIVKCLMKCTKVFPTYSEFTTFLMTPFATFSFVQLRQVLKIDPYDPKDSLVDMAYSGIEKGFIVKKKDYYNPRTEREGSAEGGAPESK